MVFGKVRLPAGVIVTPGVAGAVPVPLSPTLCGLPVALSATCSAAFRTPTALGVNVTATVQVPFAATVALPQVLEAIAKSLALAPAKVTVVIFSEAFPLLVTVTLICALVVPCVMEGNVTVPEGLIVTAGAACAVPFPVSVSVCGLPAASSAMERFACRAPVPLGLNVTPMVQDAVGATAVVQVFDATRKSPGFVPLVVIPEICRSLVPPFVTVTVIGALVISVVVSGNVRGLAGAIATAGANGPSVQLKMSCVAIRPPVPAVNPAYAVRPPTVVGISIGHECVRVALLTVSVIVIASEVPS